VSHLATLRRKPGVVLMRFRPEMVVGWYHSHPGFGCWLSSVDINTQQVGLAFQIDITPSLPNPLFLPPSLRASYQR
jgi:hypothetical protein